ncbi:hypothetical protein BC629DRAFT_1057227 [Irpex lacteus]|nr:hypothetical protein BC629DRAFT_1057227 [Irpex lacteus]
MARTTRSSEAASISAKEISSQSESDDVTLATDETSAMKAAKTRAKNRKNAEEEQLKTAKQVLAVPRSAKVKALQDAVWGSKKSMGTTGDGPNATSNGHSGGENRKRALSSSTSAQAKEPKKKKSKAELASQAKRESKTAKRPILSRSTLDDDDDESGNDSRHTPLPDKSIIITSRKPGKRKLKTVDEHHKDLQHPKKKTAVPAKASLNKGMSHMLSNVSY